MHILLYERWLLLLMALKVQLLDKIQTFSRHIPEIVNQGVVHREGIFVSNS